MNRKRKKIPFQSDRADKCRVEEQKGRPGPGSEHGSPAHTPAHACTAAPGYRQPRHSPPNPPQPAGDPLVPPSLQALLSETRHFASRRAWAEIRALPMCALGLALLSLTGAGRDRLAKLFPQNSWARSWGLRAWHRHCWGPASLSPSLGETPMSPSPIRLPQGCCWTAPAHSAPL